MLRWLIFFSTACMVSCAPKVEQTAVYIAPYAGPMMTATNIETIYSDSGETKLILKAPVQLLLQNSDREFPKGVYVEFFDEQKDPKAILTSNYAIFYKEKNLYKISGNVVIDNKRDGKKMSTEELFWSPATKKIYTDKFLVIETANEIVKGNGMDATQDFSSYTIRTVTGIVSVK
ncbi:LPS export ABC transporter periplasmic protein LptC [Cytophaga aurantiaca]|uniref:LPS export ABC transporter periplasmic protein LptC n=1 Tax=Cytophaga aurantiaca TaxID=29530 RepID=UPI00036EB0C8|nr:LPS export ABC transporter periplasmic protein LptC [Cytophaga aurantiaca]